MSDRRKRAGRPDALEPAPREHRAPLPWHRPKPAEEDASAPGRVAKLIDAPSYREADEDVAFLHRPETRGIRLQLDYWKIEALLQAHGIAGTIVVFGSTRIPEPAAAQRRLEAARAALDSAKISSEAASLARAVRVAERIVDKSRYYDVARELGRIVGGISRASPAPRKLVLMTGGGPGLMEAANRGAFDVDAETVGINITLPQPQYPNPYLTPDLCFRVHYFAIRKLHFLERARALVVFPGGYGTMDELFDTLALVQTRKIAPLPIVLVGEDYWRRAIDFDFLIDEGTIDPEDAELVRFAESAKEIWSGIDAWYAAKGEALVPVAAPSPPG